MKIIVKIPTRAATLNPQDGTVRSTLLRIGYSGVLDVREGRCLLFEVGDEVDARAFGAQIKEDLKKPQFATIFNPITDECVVEEFQVVMG